MRPPDVTINLTGNMPDPTALGRAIARFIRDAAERRAADADAQARAAMAAATTLAHVAWEARWQELTGRRWGWKLERRPSLSIALGTAPGGMVTRIWFEDLPLHRVVSGMSIEHRVGEVGEVVLRIPLALVTLHPVEAAS